MGNLCCRNQREHRNIVLLLLGLDNAGKTVAVKNLAGESIDTVIPTVGFSVVHLQYMKYNIKVYDLGGRTDFRDIWEQYYVDAHGIIFVVDASDYDRLNEASEVLTKIICHEKVRGKPLLLLANKQDHENALDEIDIIEKFQLELIVNTCECPTLVESCSASEVSSKSKLDPGIKKGYNWILNYIIRQYKILNTRVEDDVRMQEEIDRKEREAKRERLKQLNEAEKAEENNEVINNKPSNGFALSDVYIIRNNKYKHSDSDSSQSLDSLPQVYYGTIQQEVIPTMRPKSATSIVRQQLELDNLHRKNSIKFHSNKTTPVHLYEAKTPRSAGERKAAKPADRRTLKSAGDSIFIVSNGPKFTLPVNNGSGDLRMFQPLSTHKNVLPPIDTIRTCLPNGVQETNFDNHI